MTVVGSLTIHRVWRQRVPYGRSLAPIETTEYIQVDRKREEHRGFAGYRLRANGRDIYRPNPRTALVTRCDLEQVFHINFDDREYAAWPLRQLPPPGERIIERPEPPAIPTVLVETETVDTGERRELFGRPARHVITTRRVVRLPDSPGGGSRTVTDGWYIDLDTALAYEGPRPTHAFLALYNAGDAPDIPTFKDVGEPERGYAVLTKTTEDSTAVLEIEVTHLSTADIDPATFEVPAEFRLVESIRQDPVPPLVVRLKQVYDRIVHR